MSNLQFQSFTNADFGSNNQTDSFSGRIGANDNQNSESVQSNGPKRNFFSFGFYQQFFDVDTEQVSKRLINSAVPTHNNFIADFVQPIPDLYGPFWVSVTLVFSIGIFSNIAQYIENEGGSGEYGSDFRMVTGASSLISSYVIIVPLILYGLVWHRKSEVQYSYFEILCAYGYSLSIFIPVSLLWIVNLPLLRWILIGLSVALSGTVLAKAFWPAFRNDSNKLVSFGVVFGVLFLHFLLALCFKEYFFDPIHARSPAKSSISKQSAEIAPVLPDAANDSVPAKVEKPKAAEAEGQIKSILTNAVAEPAVNETDLAPEKEAKKETANDSGKGPALPAAVLEKHDKTAEAPKTR